MKEIQIQEYLYQIWKRRKAVLAFMVGVFVVTTLFTLNQTKIYRAIVTVEIGSESPDSAIINDIVSQSGYGWWTALRYYETQYQIIKSRSLLTSVAQKAVQEGILKGKSTEDLAQQLQGKVSVKGEENSRLAYIYFDDDDPVRAQKICNLIAEVYIDENLSRKLRGVDEAIRWLNDRLGEIREEKAKKEEELQEKKKEFKVVSASDHENIAKANLIALSETLNRLKSKRIEAQAQYSKLHELVNRSTQVEDLLGVISSDLIVKLKNDLADLRSQKSKMEFRYKEKHPEMIKLNSHMKEIEKLIRQEVNHEVGRMKTTFLLAKAEEDSVSQALEKQKLEAIRIEELNRDLADIEVITSTNQQIFESLQKRIKEADLSALVRSNNIRIVDKALKPSQPIQPNVQANLLLALVVGLLGGIALALGLEYIDDTVKTHEDVERSFHLPVLAMIPHYQTSDQESDRKRLEFVSIDHPSDVVAEQYRTLRTNVLFLTRNKKMKRLLMVSTVPGEGKTVTATNLATTLAQIGLRTLILDLDFRRPKLHTLFRSSPKAGITNVLVGEVKMDSAILRSHVENLDYMPAGSIPPNPTELLSSPQLRSLLETVSSRYEYVIMDSSPIAPVTDAIVVSQMAHGVIFVIRAGKTHRKTVVLARSQLATVNSDVVGMILNDIHVERTSYSHYSYYKQGYYRYTSDAESSGNGKGGSAEASLMSLSS